MATDIEFKSWDDFKINWAIEIDKIQQNEYSKIARGGSAFKRSRRLFFRGQSSANYNLRSSFDRVMTSHGIQDFFRDRFQDYMKEFVIARSEAGLEADFSQTHSIDEGIVKDPKRLLEIAAIAQHSGLPTRLLDWSRSPYVAAFFAFIGNSPPADPHVAIWCLDWDRIRAADSVRDSDVVFMSNQVKGNSRQVAQGGAFTLNLTKLINLEDVFLKSSQFMQTDPSAEVLFRIKIPKSERSKVLDDLSLMRITDLTLFPDDNGVVRHMKWRLDEKEFSNSRP